MLPLESMLLIKVVNLQMHPTDVLYSLGPFPRSKQFYKISVNARLSTKLSFWEDDRGYLQIKTKQKCFKANIITLHESISDLYNNHIPRSYNNLSSIKR